MNIMREEKEIFDAFFPGFRKKIDSIDEISREKADNPCIEWFRQASGPGLLVPTCFGGLGASAIKAVAVHRTLGSMSPSLAVAATMHNFTVAFLKEYSLYGDSTARYLKDVASDKLYLASGFAEGTTQTNILDYKMKAVPHGEGYLVSGTKTPCTLALGMDYLTAGVAVFDPISETTQRGVAIIPSSEAGIAISPYWKINALAGAQTHQVTLDKVYIDKANIFLTNENVNLDAVEAVGFLWFEMLVTSSYLGVATRLLEKVYESNRYNKEERIRLCQDIETSASALRGIAYEIDSHTKPEDVTESIVARVLLVRFGIQQSIQRSVSLATEMLGGIGFLNDPFLENAIAASNALAFHPPSRLSASGSLDTYIAGGSLDLS